MKLEMINTKYAPEALGAYSQAILSGNTLFLSGQIAIDPETNKLIEGGIKEQTDRVLKNINAILKEAGFTTDNVCKVVCSLKNIGDAAGMNEVYSKVFTKHKPARALFEVSSLPLNALIEIEVIAMK